MDLGPKSLVIRCDIYIYMRNPVYWNTSDYWSNPIGGLETSTGKWPESTSINPICILYSECKCKCKCGWYLYKDKKLKGF